MEVVVIRPELSGSALPLFEEVAAVGTAPDFGVAADAHGPVGVDPRAHAVAQLVHRGRDCRDGVKRETFRGAKRCIFSARNVDEARTFRETL